MSSPSLQKAAVLSLLIHITIFTLAVIIPKKSPVVSPERLYKVTLVSPEARPGKEIGPAKKVRIPPSKEKFKPEKAVPEPKPTAEREKFIPKDYISDRLDSIKKTKEVERYKSEKLDAIEKNIRLKGIRQKAVSRSKEAEGEPDEAQAGGPYAAEIYDSYIAKVQASIYNVWVYPDIDIKGLKSVISVNILENGKIVVNRFESPSGNKLFDRSALKAINKASPVEPPPSGSALDDVLLNFYPDLED
jgi:TonB family protein